MTLDEALRELLRQSAVLRRKQQMLSIPIDNGLILQWEPRREVSILRLARLRPRRVTFADIVAVRVALAHVLRGKRQPRIREQPQQRNANWTWVPLLLDYPDDRAFTRLHTRPARIAADAAPVSNDGEFPLH